MIDFLSNYPFFIIPLSLSALLIIHLWIFRKDRIYWKLIWTIVIFVPVVGIVFYIAFYNPPLSLSKSDQDKKGGVENYRGDFGRKWK